MSKLEAAGWLGRAPWIWGEGSVVWLTSLGTECVGLGGLRPIKAPPSNTLTSHSVLVGWSAARWERRGRKWKSARELWLDDERWAIPIRCDRGCTRLLPDLVGWIKADRPIAVVAESGHRREDRQKWILEGWRDAILADRYAGVRYDCATESVAEWIRRLAKMVWLRPPAFSAHAQRGAEEIAALARVSDDVPAIGHHKPVAKDLPGPDGPADADPVPAAVPAPPVQPERPASAPPPDPETAESVEARMSLYRDVFGLEEPKPRHRWSRPRR